MKLQPNTTYSHGLWAYLGLVLGFSTPQYECFTEYHKSLELLENTIKFNAKLPPEILIFFWLRPCHGCPFGLVKVTVLLISVMCTHEVMYM